MNPAIPTTKSRRGTKKRKSRNAIALPATPPADSLSRSISSATIPPAGVSRYLENRVLAHPLTGSIRWLNPLVAMPLSPLLLPDCFTVDHSEIDDPLEPAERFPLSDDEMDSVSQLHDRTSP